MTKICPNCQKEYDDEQMFCTQCGTKLEEKQETSQADAPAPALSLGDANAVSGGIHVDQSTHVESHDVHYHTTQERTKSEKEVEQENRKQYHDAVANMMQHGVISVEARRHLDDLRIDLNIDPQAAAQIEAVVKKSQTVNTSTQSLNTIGKMALKGAITAVKDNTPEAKKSIAKLSGVCKTTTDEQVHFYYYMLLSAYKPQQCVDAYEHRDQDSYWQSFWTILAYRKLGQEEQAETILNELSNLWPDRPEMDTLVNAGVGLLLSSRGNLDKCRDEVVEFLNQSSAKPSELLDDLFHALLHKLEMEDKNKTEYAFYEECFFTMEEEETAEQVGEVDEYDSDIEKAEEACERNDYDTATSIWKKWADQNDTWSMNKLAFHYYEEDNALMAFNWFLKAAELGDSEAQCAVAIFYSDGSVVPQDYAEAYKWYFKAADQDNPIAQCGLGEMYYFGYGVPESNTEAFKWFLKAVEHDHSNAQLYLGKMYYRGDGLTKNYTEAYKWFLKAEEEEPGAQYYLGEIFYYGNGVKKDYAEAMKWYRKAADREDDRAQHSLGYMYYQGEGVQKDNAEAMKWFRMAADQGNSNAQYYLGLMYFRGDGVSVSYTDAYNWFLLAGEQGRAEAQFFLGAMYEAGEGVDKDLEEAVKWYQMAAEQDLDEAKEAIERLSKELDDEEEEDDEEEVDEVANFVQLADQYYQGKEVKQDLSKAFSYYAKAGNQGNAYAQCFAGYMREYGKGVNRDLQEAVKWYKMAIAQGSAYAHWRLGVMYMDGKGVPQNYQEAKRLLQVAVNGGQKDAKADYDRVCTLLSRPKVEIANVRNSNSGKDYFFYVYPELKFDRNCTVRADFTLKTPYGLKLNNTQYFQIEKDGFYYVDAKGNKTLDKKCDLHKNGMVGWAESIGTERFKLNYSGIFEMDGFLTISNASNPKEIYDSKQMSITMHYHHRLFGMDRITVTKVTIK